MKKELLVTSEKQTVGGLTVYLRKTTEKIVKDEFVNSNSYSDMKSDLLEAISHNHTEKRFVGTKTEKIEGKNGNKISKLVYEYIDLPTIEQLSKDMYETKFESVNEMFLFAFNATYDVLVKYCSFLARNFSEIETHDIVNELYNFLAVYPFSDKWANNQSSLLIYGERFVGSMFYVAKEIAKRFTLQAKKSHNKCIEVQEIRVFDGEIMEVTIPYFEQLGSINEPMHYGGKTEIEIENKIIMQDIKTMLDKDELKAFKAFKQGITVRQAVEKGIKRRKYDSMKNKLQEYAKDYAINGLEVAPIA